MARKVVYGNSVPTRSGVNAIQQYHHERCKSSPLQLVAQYAILSTGNWSVDDDDVSLSATTRREVR